jgi:hypothetical protein
LRAGELSVGARFERAHVSKIAGLLFLLVGIAIGFVLPDADLKLRFLGHRSIVTHGFLLALLLYGFARQKENMIPRFLAVGVSLSSAIHLSFDLFPRSWAGYALIYIPMQGRTSMAFSWVWIAVSIVACIYLALALVQSIYELVVVAGSMVAAFGVYATQEAVFWPSLAALAVGTVLALMLPSDSGILLRRLREQEAAWDRGH